MKGAVERTSADPEHLTKLFGVEVLMMKIGADQKNCICQKGRSRRVGQNGCRSIIGIKAEQRAEHAICFVAVLVIKVEGLQIGKKLSEPGRADRGTDGRGRGKGGLIEQRGSFFSGKFHPGIFPWIPRVRIIANRIIRINQKAFAGVNGESFFMIFDKALPAQNIMDDIDRRTPGPQECRSLQSCLPVASRVRPGWESDPKTDEFIKRPPDLQDAGDDV